MFEIMKKETVDSLEKAVQLGLTAHDLKGRFEKTFALAQAVADIRSLLTDDVMKPIMALQGTKTGFKTDKDRENGYPIKVVRECMIEALLEGVYPVMNQMNIIGGNAYITKEGMGQKLKDTPKLNYYITPGVPHMSGDGKGAIVKMAVDWEWNGEKGTKELEVCTKVNSGMGADAIIGKATRKTRAWLYQYLTGREVPDGEADDVGVTIDVKAEVVEPQKTKTEKLKDKIKTGKRMEFPPQDAIKTEVDPATGEEIPLKF